MGQTVTVWVVETPLSLASHPTHFHTFMSALYHFILYVCVCTGLLSVSVFNYVLQRKVKKQNKTESMSVFSCVICPPAHMPPKRQRLYFVGFVVEADKYEWTVHNIFVVVHDVIFPIALMTHLSTLTYLSEQLSMLTTHILN